MICATNGMILYVDENHIYVLVLIKHVVSHWIQTYIKPYPLTDKI